MCSEDDDDDLIPVFMPPLVALPVRAEELNGAPLTRNQALAIRDNVDCAMRQRWRFCEHSSWCDHAGLLAPAQAPSQIAAAGTASTYQIARIAPFPGTSG